MGFNESIHAYIAARYYTRMQEAFASRAEPAFINAVQYYAGQRGRRMAQRAIRDGKPLTHATFLQYGELKMTDEVEPTQRQLVSRAPDYELHISACPWHAQFKRMGCLEAGDVYCRHVDEALCRGFSPDIRFQALANLNSADHCVHRVAGANPQGLADEPPMEQYKRDFSYHCGHLYWSFSEVVSAIFGAAGEAVAAGVLGDVARTYGASMADELAAWRHTDFNIC